MNKKYFTPSEATQIIPMLESAFSRLYQIRMLSQTTLSRLEELGFAPEDGNFRVHSAGANFDAIDELASLKMLMMELRKQIEALAEAGCLVKDIKDGLVDFLARRGRRDIFLCWKLGEKRVGHWHEIDAGFKERQPLLKPKSPRNSANFSFLSSGAPPESF